MPDLSCVCDLHCSSWQCQILNPLIRASDRTQILMDISQVRLCWATIGTPLLLFFFFFRQFVFFYHWIFKNPLCTLNIRTVSDTWLENILISFCGLCFHSLNHVFAEHGLSIFFSSWILPLVSYLRTNLRSRRFFPFFCLLRITVSCLHLFRSTFSFYTGEKCSLRFIYLPIDT